MSDHDLNSAVVAHSVILENLYILVAKQFADPAGHCDKAIALYQKVANESAHPESDMSPLETYARLIQFYQTVKDRLIAEA